MNNNLLLPSLGANGEQRSAYAATLFTLFFFVPWIAQGPSLTLAELLLPLMAYVIFVITYCLSIDCSANKITPYIVVLFIAALVASCFSYGGAVLLGFTSFLVGYFYRLTIGLYTMLLISLLVIAISYWRYDFDTGFLLAVVVNVSIVFGYGIVERLSTLDTIKQTETQQAMIRLSAIAERERISRDLHDIAGHALTGISLKAQLANKLLDRCNQMQAQSTPRQDAQPTQLTQQLQQELTDITALSQQLLSDIRNAVSDLKVLSLDDELTALAHQLRQQDFIVDVHCDQPALDQLTALQETHIGLLFKEAVTNILRHSKGKHVELSLRYAQSHILVRVFDDGVINDGDVNDKVIANYLTNNGLVGLQQRVETLGGSCTISNTNGWQIEAVIPVSQGEHK